MKQILVEIIKMILPPNVMLTMEDMIGPPQQHPAGSHQRHIQSDTSQQLIPSLVSIGNLGPPSQVWKIYGVP